MAISTITVTGLHIQDFGGTPLNGVIMFTASHEVADQADDLLIEGTATGIVTAGVMASVTIPCTDAVSPPFTYTIRQDLATADGTDSNIPPAENVSIPASMGPSVDISALV